MDDAPLARDEMLRHIGVIFDVRAVVDNQLKNYWTKTPEGLAKWAAKPHPWTALYHHLRKYVGSERAKRIAAEWFHDVKGYWPGDQKGKNPVGPG